MFTYFKKISLALYFISCLLPNALAKPNQKENGFYFLTEKQQKVGEGPTAKISLNMGGW